MIKQVVYFSVEPIKVYDALMDHKKHAEFTGSKAIIDPVAGGKFEVWDGYATGENIDLVPGKKIVQSWKASDWPKGVTSVVRYDFEKQNEGTKLIFTHKGVPKDFEKDIAQGWLDYYWTPLKTYVSSK